MDLINKQRLTFGIIGLLVGTGLTFAVAQARRSQPRGAAPKDMFPLGGPGKPGDTPVVIAGGSMNGHVLGVTWNQILPTATAPLRYSAIIPNNGNNLIMLKRFNQKDTTNSAKSVLVGDKLSISAGWEIALYSRTSTWDPSLVPKALLCSFDCGDPATPITLDGTGAVYLVPINGASSEIETAYPAPWNDSVPSTVNTFAELRVHDIDGNCTREGIDKESDCDFISKVVITLQSGAVVTDVSDHDNTVSFDPVYWCPLVHCRIRVGPVTKN